MDVICNAGVNESETRKLCLSVVVRNRPIICVPRAITIPQKGKNRRDACKGITRQLDIGIKIGSEDVSSRTDIGITKLRHWDFVGAGGRNVSRMNGAQNRDLLRLDRSTKRSNKVNEGSVNRTGRGGTRTMRIRGQRSDVARKVRVPKNRTENRDKGHHEWQNSALPVDVRPRPANSERTIRPTKEKYTIDAIYSTTDDVNNDAPIGEAQRGRKIAERSRRLERSGHGINTG